MSPEPNQPNSPQDKKRRNPSHRRPNRNKQQSPGKYKTRRKTNPEKPSGENRDAAPVNNKINNRPQDDKRRQDNNRSFQKKRFNENANWKGKDIRIEETFDDIKEDINRIEKEIWLEIAEIHNAGLD